MSETTIGLSRKIKMELFKLKEHKKESYEDVILRLLKK
jgi:predicted CopG family antitoxin